MVDALKRGSAKRITVVLPFYAYARQDKKHRGREPISARLMADLFKTAGAEPDPHRRPAHRADPGLLRRPGGPPVRDGRARRLRREPLRRPADDRRRARTPAACGSPSAGPTASAAARWPSSTRPATRSKPNQVVANRVVGEVEGRVCLIVDDMIDTGGTICKAAEILFDDGRGRRHRRRDPRACSPTRRSTGCKNSKISEVVVTNTLPMPPRSASTRSRCCRSRRCSPGPSARSSTTAR